MFKNTTLTWKTIMPKFVPFFVLIEMAFSFMGPYYSLAVRRFRTILGVGLRIFSYFRGDLRLTNDGSVTENFAFSLGFRFFMHFHKRITVLEVAVSV